MGFASDTGYVPQTVDQLMELVREGINEQFGTTYTRDNFIGTNFYKYFYALIQRLQENEVKTSEIVLRMQEYFRITNEKVLRPNTTHPGIYDYFLSKGFLVSTKPPADVDAGKVYICVDVDETADDYDDTKLEICNLVKDCVVAGVVSQGTESELITLDNGQEFSFNYNLPDRIPVLLRLTLTLSENNLFAVGDVADVAALLLERVTTLYSLGKNFEPQRYFSILDAPWAGEILLEYSIDAGANWETEIYDSAYDDLFTFDLEDIEIVEA